MKIFAINTYKWFEKKLMKDKLDSYSAQSAFFIIIAFIPFLLLLLSLFSVIDINGENAVEFIIGFMPKDVADFFKDIFFLGYKPVALLSAASFTCLWSSSKAMLAIIKGLNSVFGVKDTRNYFVVRAMSIAYTFAFAVILALTTVILVFGNSIYTLIAKYINPNFSSGIFDNKTLWSFLMLAFFFSATYKLIPYKTKIPFKFCLIGASLSAVGWIVFSFLFAFFVENFSNYSNIYGSLAALVIVMLWLYICMYIMLFGGEISMWLYEEKLLKKFQKK